MGASLLFMIPGGLLYAWGVPDSNIFSMVLGGALFIFGYLVDYHETYVYKPLPPTNYGSWRRSFKGVAGKYKAPTPPFYPHKYSYPINHEEFYMRNILLPSKRSLRYLHSRVGVKKI